VLRDRCSARGCHEPTTRRLLDLLPAGSGSVGGALVGLALGGPGGALVGAAVELLDLAAVVVAAASETIVEAMIRVLGRALATGALASDDAVVEEQRFLVDFLADLEAPHIRLLAQVSVRHAGYGSPRDPEVTPGLTAGRSWTS
jgi:hypothetical protein